MCFFSWTQCQFNITMLINAHAWVYVQWASSFSIHIMHAYVFF